MFTNSQIGYLVVVQGVLWQANHFIAGMLCGLVGALLILEDFDYWLYWREEWKRVEAQSRSATMTQSTESQYSRLASVQAASRLRSIRAGASQLLG